MNVSTKRIGVVTAAVAVVLVMAWYIALFRPQSSHLRTARSDYSAAQQQITQLQQQKVSLDAILREKPKDEATLAQLKTAVPTTPDLKTVLLQLHQLAVGSGVQLTVFNPSNPYASTGPSGAGSSAKAVTLSMTASGPYPAMTAFFTGLAHLPRDITVDTVSLGAGGGTPSGLSASLSARMFYAP